MSNPFILKLDKIAIKLEHNVKGQSFDTFLEAAICLWCYELEIDNDNNLSNFIINGYKNYIKDYKIIEYLWKQGNHKQMSLTQNDLYKYLNSFFTRISQNFSQIKYITILAFIITAVGYFIYKLNNPKQDEVNYSLSSQKTPSQSDVTSPKTSVNKPNVTFQQIENTDNLLILVIDVNNETLINSLKSKKKIESYDCDQLYKATQYLCQDTESNFSEKWKQQYLQESNKIRNVTEYDIVLIKIKLKKSEAGFKKNVDKLDRLDAFKKLHELAISFEVSEPLPRESYRNFQVYKI